MWLCTTQRCVVLSNTESEYVAIGECVKKVLFLRRGPEVIEPTTEVTGMPVYEDKLSEDPQNSANPWHIGGRHSFSQTLAVVGLLLGAMWEL